MSLRMDSNSKRGRVLALIAEGDATTADLVAEFGWTPQIAAAHLSALYAAGKLKRQPYSVPGVMSRWLYSITPKGLTSIRCSTPGGGRVARSGRAPTS